MTDERLKELAALCEAATPGPWDYTEEWICANAGSDEWEAVLDPYTRAQHDECTGEITDCDAFLHWQNDADIKFIAAARTAFPELIARVRELEATNERMRDLLQQVCEPCAFGEERYLDPVFGQYKHSVSGVYGISEVRCEIGRRR